MILRSPVRLQARHIGHLHSFSLKARPLSVQKTSSPLRCRCALSAATASPLSGSSRLRPLFGVPRCPRQSHAGRRVGPRPGRRHPSAAPAARRRGRATCCRSSSRRRSRNILTGLKIGWAFAWRTLIAAELVFGVSQGSGGLGWYVFENKNLLEIANVFAGLFTVILIGLFVENLIFRTIEQRTIRRWGMQH